MRVDRDCGTNMVTFSGKYINPDNLQKGDLCITDIAHGLSNCCRFAGQCREFYSVAQHSVLAALCIRDVMHAQNVRAAHTYSEEYIKQLSRIVLMHDAPEAYCGDLVRCVKKIVGGEYADLENAIWIGVVDEFQIEPLYSMLQDGEDISDLPALAKEVDYRMLVTERQQLITEVTERWDLEGVWAPFEIDIAPMPPKEAESLFWLTFKELFEK